MEFAQQSLNSDEELNMQKSKLCSDMWLRRARIFYKNENLIKCKRALRLSLRFDCNNIQALLDQAVLYANVGKFISAANNLQKVFLLDPYNSRGSDYFCDLLWTHAHVLEKRYSYVEAAKMYKKILTIPRFENNISVCERLILAVLFHYYQWPIKPEAMAESESEEESVLSEEEDSKRTFTPVHSEVHLPSHRNHTRSSKKNKKRSHKCRYHHHHHRKGSKSKKYKRQRDSSSEFIPSSHVSQSSRYNSREPTGKRKRRPSGMDFFSPPGETYRRQQSSSHGYHKSSHENYNRQTSSRGRYKNSHRTYDRQQSYYENYFQESYSWNSNSYEHSQRSSLIPSSGRSRGSRNPRFQRSRRPRRRRAYSEADGCQVS